MKKQYGKASRLVSAFFVLFFTLFATAAMVDGQKRGGKKRKQVRQPSTVGQGFKPQPVVVFPTSLSLPELVKAVKPSVVFLRVFDKDGNGLKQGSAFFITPTRIVTNYHVIEGGSSGEIYTNDGFAYKVLRSLSIDTKSDLAVLEVELPADVRFKPLPIARNAVREGDSIVVIGNPEGLQGTVSPGIVSAIRQYDEPLIQISAPISHGSSGSPVINLRGEIVGVAVSGNETGQNLNFAVSSSKLAGLMESAERQSKVLRMYEDGLRLSRGGNYQRALEKFVQVVKLLPDYADAWMEIGKTQAALGNYSDAVIAFVETARLEPNNSAAHYSAGIVYTELNRNAEAAASFRRVLAIDPNNADTYFVVGNAFYKLNDFRSAADLYNQVIRLRPNDENAYYNLGLVFIAQGERKSARKIYKKLMAMGSVVVAAELLQNIPR